jgi:hypothetical protein
MERTSLLAIALLCAGLPTFATACGDDDGQMSSLRACMDLREAYVNRFSECFADGSKATMEELYEHCTEFFSCDEGNPVDEDLVHECVDEHADVPCEYYDGELPAIESCSEAWSTIDCMN